MKILFLTLYPDPAPSSRFRIGQYLRYFHADGIGVEIRPAIPAGLFARLSGKSSAYAPLAYYASEFICRSLALLRHSDHDVVVLQKGIMSYCLKGMDRLLDRFAGRLVFDIDDAVHLVSPNDLPRLLGFLRDTGQVARVMQRSAAVIAANEQLAQAARQYNANVHVLPTAVDTDYFKPAEKPKAWDGVLKLLWTGNRSANACVNSLAPALARLAQQGVAVRLAVVSDSPDFLDVERFPKGVLRYDRWSVQTERAHLAWADAGVMPLEDNIWNQFKSGYKAMLMMAAGLPVICSPVGSITQVIRHAQNGFLAREAKTWHDAMLRLAKEPELRERLGHAARRTIVEGYSTRMQYPRLKQIMFGVAGSAANARVATAQPAASPGRD